MRKYYLVKCVEFPEDIQVGDTISMKRVSDINAAYYEGRFIGSVSSNVDCVNGTVTLIGRNVDRNMKLLVEAA